jgi:4-amino-4-deoxy-L-arabinose transferase-like glycosyltransferase
VSRSVRPFLAIAVLVGLVLATGIMLSVPPLAGNDEAGHLQAAAFLHCERRLPTASDPTRFDHPPLYYAFVALTLGVMPADQVTAWIRDGGRTELDLPYEKRVAIDLTATNGDPRRGYAVSQLEPRPLLANVATHPVPEALVILWRSSGLVLLLATAAFVIAGLRSLGASDRPLAALAAAAVILVPGFSAIFATINNDQFAVLFSTAAAAVLLSAGDPARLRTGRALAAGVLGACALLSKTSAIGAIAGCAVWVAFSGPGRLKRLAAFLLPGALALGWFYARTWSIIGHLDIGRAAGEARADLLRNVAPDASGNADALAQLAMSLFGSVGGDAIAPGRLLVLAGLAVPAIAIGGALLAALSRRTERTSRVAAAAFLGGLAVQLAALLFNNRHSFYVHGRYLQPLAMLGALALFVGARELFGPRARVVLAAAVTLLGVMGLEFLHGRVIPSFHPPRDRYGSPDFAAYVDAGLPTHARFVERGRPVVDAQWGPKPEGSVLRDPSEVRLRVSGLDPAGAYVAWVRLHALDRTLEIEDFLADGLPLGGPHAPSGVADWRRFPIPRQATRDGTVTVSAHALVGQASIAELLVTRLPLEVAAASESEGRVEIRLRSAAPGRLPALRAALRRPDGGVTAPIPVAFDAGGAAALGFGDTHLPAELLLIEPESPWLDVKLSPFVTAAAEKRGAIASPGIEVARVPASVEANALVCGLPELPLVPGDYRLEIVDEHSAPIPAGRLAIAYPDGRREDASAARFTVAEGAARSPALEIRHAGGAPFVLDRLRLHRAPAHVFELAAR